MDLFEISLTGREVATLLPVLEHAMIDAMRDYRREERHIRLMSQVDADSECRHAEMADVLESRFHNLKMIKRKVLGSYEHKEETI